MLWRLRWWVIMLATNSEIKRRGNRRGNNIYSNNNNNNNNITTITSIDTTPHIATTTTIQTILNIMHTILPSLRIHIINTDINNNKRSCQIISYIPTQMPTNTHVIRRRILICGRGDTKIIIICKIIINMKINMKINNINNNMRTNSFLSNRARSTI